jgi:hypothetical protein
MARIQVLTNNASSSGGASFNTGARIPVLTAQPAQQSREVSSSAVDSIVRRKTSQTPAPSVTSNVFTQTPQPIRPSRVQVKEPASPAKYFFESLAETVNPFIKAVKEAPPSELEGAFKSQDGKPSYFVQELPNAAKKAGQDVLNFMFGLPIEFGLQVAGKDKANIPVIGEVKRRGLVVQEQQRGEDGRGGSAAFAQSLGLHGTAADLVTILQPFITEDLLRSVATAGEAFRAGQFTGRLTNFKLVAETTIPATEVIPTAKNRTKLEEFVFGKEKIKSYEIPVTDKNGATGIAAIKNTKNGVRIKLYAPRDLNPAKGAEINAQLLPSGLGDVTPPGYDVTKATPYSVPIGVQAARSQEGFANYTAYHGSAYNFSHFDESKRGVSTNAPSAKEATFFTSKKSIADGYAELGGGQQVIELRAEADRLETEARRTNNQDLFDKAARLSDQADNIELGQAREGTQVGNVQAFQLNINNPLVVQKNGTAFNEKEAVDIIQQAKKDGYDSVIFRNVADAVDTPIGVSGKRPDSEVYAVFDNAKIKTTEEYLKEIKDEVVQKLTEKKYTPAQKIKAEERSMKSGRRKGFAEGYKVARDEIITKAKEKSLDVQAAKNEVYQFAKNTLPPQERGKFMTAVRDAKNPTDVWKAFSRIDKYAQKIEVAKVISQLKATAKKLIDSPSIAVDYREQIRTIIDGYELAGHQQATIDQLKATQDYINRLASVGEDVEMPQRILDKLKILGRVPKDEITLEQAEALLEQIQLLARLGETKWSSKQALYEAEKAVLTETLLDTAAMIDSKKFVPESIGDKPSQYASTYIKIRNYLQKSKVSLMPMEGVADITGMQPIKIRLDTDFNNYLSYNDKAFQEWYDLTKDFDESNFERIGVYAIAQQDGGIERLANNGITEDMVNDLNLTAEEKAAYNFVREKFDSEYPAVKRYMRDVYNEDVGQVKNYVSFLSDSDAMSDLDIFDRFGQRASDVIMKTKSVEKGFTKERAAQSANQLQLNIDKIFRRHLDDVAYMLNMGRDVKMFFEIVNTPAMREKLGDVGTLAWLQYLDLMARKGGTPGAQRIAALDVLRKNVAAGVLSLRLSSALVQFSSFADTLGTLGVEWSTKGAASIATSAQWRSFILDNFPEVKKAIGDDVAFREFGSSLFSRLAEKGLKPLQVLDGLMRSTAAAGAYQKAADELGIVVDLENPNSDLIDIATKSMRQSQGSSFFKDQPLAITTGMGLTENRSVNKTLLTFQSFMLNRWDNIWRQVWRLGIKEKRFGKAFMSFFWLVLFAAAAEEGLRRGSRSIINWISELLGGDKKENQNTFAQSYAMNLAQNIPIVGQIVSSMTYSSNPIPIVNALEDAIAGAGSLITGKTPETRLRGFLNLVGGAGSMTGLPGISQASQILRGAIPSSSSSNQSGTLPGATGPGLPELPQLPQLP